MVYGGQDGQRLYLNSVAGHAAHCQSVLVLYDVCTLVLYYSHNSVHITEELTNT